MGFWSAGLREHGFQKMIPQTNSCWTMKTPLFVFVNTATLLMLSYDVSFFVNEIMPHLPARPPPHRPFRHPPQFIMVIKSPQLPPATDETPHPTPHTPSMGDWSRTTGLLESHILDSRFYFICFWVSLSTGIPIESKDGTPGKTQQGFWANQTQQVSTTGVHNGFFQFENPTWLWAHQRMPRVATGENSQLENHWKICKQFETICIKTS